MESVTQEMLQAEARKCKALNACTEGFAIMMLLMCEDILNNRNYDHSSYRGDIVAHVTERACAEIWKVCDPDTIQNVYALASISIRQMAYMFIHRQQVKGLVCEYNEQLARQLCKST